MLGQSRNVRRKRRVCVSFQLWSASLRVPFGLGKCVILLYIVVALGFVGVNVIGFVGCVS